MGVGQDEVLWAEAHDKVLCYLHLLIDATILARVPFREKFARSCFEALLQFSFLHSQDSNIGECVCVCVCVCVCMCRGGRREQTVHTSGAPRFCHFFVLVPRPNISAGSECITGEVQRGPRKVCARREAEWAMSPA